MSQPKVFEFAKEIGMETLALMDKIREWKLPVKSHMAELTPAMIDEIKTKLDAPLGEAAPVAKKKAPAKKKATAKAKAKAPAKPPKPIKGGTSQALAAAAAATAAEAEATSKKVVVKKSAPAVVRRKSAATTEPDEAMGMPAQEDVDATLAAKKTVTRRKSAEALEASTPLSAEEAPVASKVVQDPVREVETPQAAPVQVSPAAQEVAAPPAAVDAAPEATEPVKVPEAAPVIRPKVDGPASAGGPIRRVMREVTMTSDGPRSGVKSEAPKRNIVGRMDLSRVDEMRKQQGAPAFGPRGSGMTGSGATSGGPIQMRSQRTNIRTGFVAQHDSPPPFENPDENRSRFDRTKKHVAPRAPTAQEVAAANAAREREETPPVFTASEFRKREMVFQPKKKKGLLNREGLKTQITTPKASKRVVKMYQTIKLGELAQEMGVKVPQLTKTLIQNGVMANMNTELDFDTVSLIAPEFGFEAQNIHRSDREIIETGVFGDLKAESITRAPIVTIMGHVDHGKTTLLDNIRSARVAAKEAGGITQHIGAYQVKTDQGMVTFIDTPGHEAFTGMRARGANVTDIAVVVVAADDGVMPQTIEAISHAKAANVPIVVAVNKIDKPAANPDRIKQQLTEYELIPEEWGGSTIFCEVSALKGTGVENLLEQLALHAEILELKANPKRSATGVVVESKVEKGRGNVATVLIKDGTLRVGDFFVVGTIPGRVRNLLDFQGKPIKEAGPSTPVEIMGINGSPLAGDHFDAVIDEKTAAQVAEQRLESKVKVENKPASKMTLEDLFSKVQRGETKELPLILKADVAGSLEAITGMLAKVGTDEVKPKVIHSAVGGISESDVLLAKTAGGVIVGFNVRPDTTAQNLAKQHNVEIKTYSIVYELMDDMKKALSGLLSPDVVEVVLGSAEVRNTFTVPKIGTIAGSYVTNGKITRSSQLRLVRDGKVVYQGNVASLKRFKDDAKEVLQGFECGIGIENFNDLKVGDVIEAFTKEERQRELN